MKENKKRKNVNQKKGISLIVLVITIIVIVILAVAVILSIANNNPIENANKAKFQNDVKSMQEELELIKAKNYAESNGANYGNIKFTDLTGANKYDGKFKVVEGELVYTGDLQGDELIWAQELGIKEGEYSFAFTGEGSDYGVEDIDFDFVDNCNNGGPRKATKIITNNKTNKYTSLVITDKGMIYYLDGTDYATEDSTFLSLEKDDSWKSSEYLEFPKIVKDFPELFGCVIGGVKNLNFAEGVENIYFSWTYIGEVKLPSTAKNVTFDNCTGFTSITIPKKVESIYFNGCSNLSSITISKDVENLKIEAYAFDGSGVTDIYLPKGVTSIAKDSFWRNY